MAAVRCLGTFGLARWLSIESGSLRVEFPLHREDCRKEELMWKIMVPSFIVVLPQGLIFLAILMRFLLLACVLEAEKLLTCTVDY